MLDHGGPITHYRHASQSVKILLVDDSTVLARRLIDALVEYPQFDIIGSVDTEAEALRMIGRRRVDLLLLDLHLKAGSGFGVMRALIKDSRAPQIIVLTNHDLPEYRTAALNLGAFAFLDKARHFYTLPEILTKKFAHSSLTEPSA
jgi:DNA-binding NarL/FixJ family response regulator